MPHGKPLVESSFTKIVAMCPCPIGEVFHRFIWHN